MSDVLIKRMEMPMYWYECPFCSDGYCFMIPDENDRICLVDSKEDTHRNENCPLVPIPPHGRLIDADALLNLLNNCMFPSDMVTTTALSMATNWIKEAPTIIEAEEDRHE